MTAVLILMPSDEVSYLQWSNFPFSNKCILKYEPSNLIFLKIKQIIEEMLCGFSINGG
jgi:hypothetical protein